MVQNCSTCQTYQIKQQKEPLISIAPASHPWERVGSDLFTHENQDYLIMVDYFSNFPEVIKMR